MRLCIKCRHCLTIPFGQPATEYTVIHQCAHPELVLKIGPSPVTGKTKEIPPSCYDMRATKSELCGYDGKLWEPKAD